MQETGVQTPGWEDFLEKETATHPSGLFRKLHGHGSLASYSPLNPHQSLLLLSLSPQKAPQIVLTQSLGWGHPTCSL